MIRMNLLKEILDVISKSQYFSEHDFDIEHNAVNNGTNLLISYKYDNKYYFKVLIPDKKQKYDESAYAVDFVITGRRCPGDLSFDEQISYIGRKELIEGIETWIHFMKQDFLAMPVYRKLEEQKQEVESLKEMMWKIPDEYFTREEAAELKRRLDEMEQKFSQYLKAEINNQKEFEEKQAALHEQIETLKSQIDSFKKPGWFGTFLGRLAVWSTDPSNQPLIQSGKQAAQILLTEAVQSEAVGEPVIKE